MDEMIENQRRIPREKWRYGLRASADTGCGWIATYNALCLLGCRAEPEDLIHYYERILPLVHGNFGTTFWAPAQFFHRHGFQVEMCFRQDRFDGLAKGADACILFYRWRRKWRLGAHFAALSYRDGRFLGYNTFTTSAGPDDYGPSLEAFLKKQGYFTPMLLAIWKKE